MAAVTEDTGSLLPEPTETWLPLLPLLLPAQFHQESCPQRKSMHKLPAAAGTLSVATSASASVHLSSILSLSETLKCPPLESQPALPASYTEGHGWCLRAGEGQSARSLGLLSSRWGRRGPGTGRFSKESSGDLPLGTADCLPAALWLPLSRSASHLH